VHIFQAWGMTETSPVATYSRPLEGEHDDAYWAARARQGRPLPWVELRLMGAEDQEVAWDGESTGEIEVRGPWIASRYFRDESGDEKFDSGWLRTGDIASVNGDSSRDRPRRRRSSSSICRGASPSGGRLMSSRSSRRCRRRAWGSSTRRCFARG